MAFINPIIPENAEGIVHAEYEKGVRRSGRVYNILKIMSRSPEALQASMRIYPEPKEKCWPPSFHRRTTVFTE